MATASTSVKYFNALSFNKRNAYKLQEAEVRLDVLERKMLTRFWQDKYQLLDDLVQINVRTPRYEVTRKTDVKTKTTTISLGDMAIDRKLFHTKPITLSGSRKDGAKVSPVIDVVGSEAICYPHVDAKKGRHVSLLPSTFRIFKAVKTHCTALDNLAHQKETRIIEKPRRPGERINVDLLRPTTVAVGRPRVRSYSNRNATGQYSKLLDKRPKTAFS